MSAAKHTPGPWAVFEHSWCETSITAPNFDHAICALDINHATEDSQAGDEAQMAANARLIAAAPATAEMAMAFTMLVERLIRGDLPDGIEPASESEVAAAMYELRAHIAKATGEQE